jgi:hypothetical protein
VLTRLSVRAQLPLADGRELHGLPMGAATVCARTKLTMPVLSFGGDKANGDALRAQV